MRLDDINAPLQLQIVSLDYSSYVGQIGIGRIARGTIKPSQEVAVIHGPDGSPKRAKIGQVLTFNGLERQSADKAIAGDIVLITGIDPLSIGDTLCAWDTPEALPLLVIDEPTLSMSFQVNTSPLAGREGQFVTSRQLRERLQRELKSNVALRVRETDNEMVFDVSGRGELHLTILLENMRREGYELAVGRPQVVYRTIDNVVHEPYETLLLDIEQQHQGPIIEELGNRRAELLNMHNDPNGRVRLEYRLATRALIGFQSEFMTITRGTGILNRLFDGYFPVDLQQAPTPSRRQGVLISQEDGAAVAYALWKLQERGRMFVSPNEAVYEGMIIGIHSRDNDLVVNPVRTKQLTNVRASGTDEAIRLVPPIQLTLEYAVEFIADDELAEITPTSIRLRKRHLKEHERKKAKREE